MLGSQTQPSTSNPRETQVGLRYDALPVGGTDHLRKDCSEDVFCKDAEQGLTLQKCAMYPTKQVGATPFAFIVVVLTTFQPGVTTNLMIIEKNQGQHLGISENVDQIIATTGGINPR